MTATIDHIPNRTIRLSGRDYVFFSGTAYLGMAQNPAFQALVADALGRYGTVFGSSRNGNLQLGIYEAAEARLADWTGSASALTVSSGMLAGQAVMQWLASQNQPIFYGPGAHPALWHQQAITIPALSFPDWAAQLPDALGQAAPGPVVLAMNALDAVRSEVYDFSWVTNLPANRPITLVVDDSHGLGVTGSDGGGVWASIPKRPHIRLIVTASLAKAMGLPGGIIFGDADTVAAIRQTAFFGGCSPMSPVFLDAFLRAEDLYRQARTLLARNVALAEALLLPTGLFQQAPDYPVFYTDHDALYPDLLKNGMFIYSFAYPTAADKANTRVVVSAFHEPTDIHHLANAIHEVLA
ncbi:MAG: pyridoxal phosphate-dependent aminotransferase family protein [Bacteroidetes bacterium]|nr:pyridoxal phosphate-dependent aminotransferase family protein [Fibrella sp.]